MSICQILFDGGSLQVFLDISQELIQLFGTQRDSSSVRSTEVGLGQIFVVGNLLMGLTL